MATVTAACTNGAQRRVVHLHEGARAEGDWIVCYEVVAARVVVVVVAVANSVQVARYRMLIAEIETCRRRVGCVGSLRTLLEHVARLAIGCVHVEVELTGRLAAYRLIVVLLCVHLKALLVGTRSHCVVFVDERIVDAKYQLTAALCHLLGCDLSFEQTLEFGFVESNELTDAVAIIVSWLVLLLLLLLHIGP